MVFNDEDKILIKSLYLKEYRANSLGYDYEHASKQGTSLRALAVTNRLFSELPTFYRRK